MTSLEPDKAAELSLFDIHLTWSALGRLCYRIEFLCHLRQNHSTGQREDYAHDGIVIE